MRTTGATGRVFISHSHQDNELGRDLARRLRDACLVPVVDFAAPLVSTDWKKTVHDQIRAADAMLILVTPAALKSAWMMAELGMAEGFELIILPVTAGVKPSDLPGPLQTYQVIPFDQVDRAINMLSERLTTAAND